MRFSWVFLHCSKSRQEFEYSFWVLVWISRQSLARKRNSSITFFILLFFNDISFLPLSKCRGEINELLCVSTGSLKSLIQAKCARMRKITGSWMEEGDLNTNSQIGKKIDNGGMVLVNNWDTGILQINTAAQGIKTNTKSLCSKGRVVVRQCSEILILMCKIKPWKQNRLICKHHVTSPGITTFPVLLLSSSPPPPQVSLDLNSLDLTP